MTVLFLPAAQLASTHTSRFENLRASLGELLRNRFIAGSWLSAFGGCFGMGTFLTFLPSYAQNHSLSVKQIGFVFSVQGICNALSRIPAGQLSDKVFSIGKLVILGLIGIAASVGGFSICRTMVHFAILAASLGVSMGLAFTSIGALIGQASDAKLRGLAMGGFNACIYFGMMLGSVTVGYVVQTNGHEIGFLLAALFSLLMTGLFYLTVHNSFLPTQGKFGVRRPKTSC